MPEAVIVATARSPIGRAFKGSLTTIRPDDAVRQMVVAALAKVPQLDPADIGDLMLGCGLPGGEQGFNMARVVAIMLGYDHLPGATITRYCSSSLQTTRMAFHAIRAGEGDVFISAGVECVSRFTKGSSDSWPDTKNPVFATAKERTLGGPARARRTGATRVRTARYLTCTSPWGRPRRTWPSCVASPGRPRTSLASGRRTWRKRRWPTASGSATSRRSRCRTAPWSPPMTAPGRHHAGEGGDAAAGIPSRRHGHRGELLPAERRRRGGRGDERPQGGRPRHRTAGADRGHGSVRRCRRRSWGLARSRRPSRRWPGRA